MERELHCVRRACLLASGHTRVHIIVLSKTWCMMKADRVHGCFDMDRNSLEHLSHLVVVYSSFRLPPNTQTASQPARCRTAFCWGTACIRGVHGKESILSRISMISLVKALTSTQLGRTLEYFPMSLNKCAWDVGECAFRSSLDMILLILLTVRDRAYTMNLAYDIQRRLQRSTCMVQWIFLPTVVWERMAPLSGLVLNGWS